ncbi:heavy metal-associated isoprenylated plant protein 35-like [Momordica charantia]|uniref:Heavy metal-associated isoprenylated plant protein 35-like n=1 Tax=Momordica charantia TaxID=3673 RepID=A0A6J1CBH4_MOMCH|nr:heavy metal-associated isoprenylated plant protein 35-like [Momordica charantia]
MAVVCAEAASQPLRAQVWVLKVSMHCEGCKREVKKVLQSIDGVYTTIIDSEQQKVTVTGNVSLEKLTKRLRKARKHVEIWPEKPAEKGKQFIKTLETDKGNGQENGRSPSTTTPAKKVEFKFSPVKNNREEQTEKSKNNGNSPNKPTAGEAPPASNSKGNTTTGHEGCLNKSGTGQSGGEKKKKKGQPGNNTNSDNSGSNPRNGNGALNLDPDVGLKNGNPLAQQIYSGPKGYYFPTPILGLNYDAPVSGKGPEFLYHVPPISFPYSNDQTGNYEYQARPQNCLDYFSEENAHGCFIM